MPGAEQPLEAVTARPSPSFTHSGSELPEFNPPSAETKSHKSSAYLGLVWEHLNTADGGTIQSALLSTAAR